MTPTNPAEIPTCGIVVTYNSDPVVFKEVVSSAVSQLDHLIVVDNGSDYSFCSQLEPWLNESPNDKVESRASHTIVLNEKNLGLAKAFNQAIRIGMLKGRQYFVFLDHDSVMEKNAVSTLRAEYVQLKNEFRVGALHAYNLEQQPLPSDNFLLGYFKRRGMYFNGPVHEAMLAINSGMFVDSEVFEQVGLFDETYFIDAIDFEFGLRLLSRGFRLFAIDSARIRHSRGTFSQKSIGDWKWGFHRPAVWREYFVARDTLRTVKRYGRSIPVMGLFLCFVPVREMLLSVVFYGQALQRLKLLARGAVDSIRIA